MYNLSTRREDNVQRIRVGFEDIDYGYGDSGIYGRKEIESELECSLEGEVLVIKVSRLELILYLQVRQIYYYRKL